MWCAQVKLAVGWCCRCFSFLLAKFETAQRWPNVEPQWKIWQIKLWLRTTKSCLNLASMTPSLSVAIQLQAGTFDLVCLTTFHSMRLEVFLKKECTEQMRCSPRAEAPQATRRKYSEAHRVPWKQNTHRSAPQVLVKLTSNKMNGSTACIQNYTTLIWKASIFFFVCFCAFGNSFSDRFCFHFTQWTIQRVMDLTFHGQAFQSRVKLQSFSIPRRATIKRLLFTGAWKDLEGIGCERPHVVQTVEANQGWKTWGSLLAGAAWWSASLFLCVFNLLQVLGPTRSTSSAWVFWSYRCAKQSKVISAQLIIYALFEMLCNIDRCCFDMLIQQRFFVVGQLFTSQHCFLLVTAIRGDLCGEVGRICRVGQILWSRSCWRCRARSPFPWSVPTHVWVCTCVS